MSRDQSRVSGISAPRNRRRLAGMCPCLHTIVDAIDFGTGLRVTGLPLPNVLGPNTELGNSGPDIELRNHRCCST